MFYVGIVYYFATGEGARLFAASGSEESIRESIPEYFQQGITLLTREFNSEVHHSLN